jgi:hypothetical protein
MTKDAAGGRSPLAAAGLVIVAVGALGPCLLGVGWLIVYYLSETAYPVESWGYGNFTVGMSGVCLGIVAMVTGAILLIIARTQRK